MSIIEGSFGSNYNSGNEELGRTPPQDIPSEQAVLGGMLLSKDAIATVLEQIRGDDFYRPAHELVYDAILDLYGRGEPADALTVADQLTKDGTLGRVGGVSYLHTLINSVPTAANAGYYAEIVRERAILRRLVEAGTKIVQLGYAPEGGDVEQLVNEAQAEVYSVSERRQTEDYVPLSAVIVPTWDEIEASDKRGDGMIGVPTGFTELDQLTNGLHPGQMIVIAARPAIGKALALDTPIPTPTGWTTMGEIGVGDELFAVDGSVTTVVAATEVMTDRPCFEVIFDDGSTIVADAWHQWVTEVGDEQAMVRTTEELAATVVGRDGWPQHRVRLAQPLAMPDSRFEINPYLLGVWLGSGSADSSRVSVSDDELLMRLEGMGLAVESIGRSSHHVLLPERGLPLGEPSIAPEFLRASPLQRRALLAGLLDAGGGLGPDGEVQFATSSLRLRGEVGELISSLGYRYTVRTQALRGRHSSGSTTWILSFITDDQVFAGPSKALLHKESTPKGESHRYVTAVRPVPGVPVRCVQIEHGSHLYLAGRAMVPTHNSTVGLDIARAAAIHNNQTAVIFSLEMTRTEIAMRLLSAEASVSLQSMRKGPMRDDDWRKLAATSGRVEQAPLFIDDSPNMSLMEIRAKCRRLKQRHDLKLVIIDYLQLMTSGKRVESRQQEVSEFSRALKLLAKELEVPVIAISQLNRGPEQRTDKKPAMSDLRESGCLTADTKVLRADTGAEVSLGDLHAAGATDVPVWALDDSLRYVQRHLTHVFSTGVKPVFRLTLASGKQVRATGNHPFLTYNGWVPLDQLGVNSRLGVPRHVPAPTQVASWSDSEVVMLAHLLGDGSFVKRQPIRYASVDEDNLAVVAEAARHWGITAVRDDYGAARVTTLRLPAPYRLARGKRNPIAAWLDEFGLFGLRSHEKFVPEPVFHLPKRQIALFLRHIWATDGSVTVNKTERGGRVYYASTSRRLLDELSLLLLRFGISTRLRRVTAKGSYRTGYTLDISGVDSQRRFLQEIGVNGLRGTQAERLLELIRDIESNTNVDTVPTEVWDDIRQILWEKGMSHREFAKAMGTQFCGSTMWKHSPSRERLHKVAQVLDSVDLEVMAVNDLLWDRVIAIEEDGVEEVYDATVLGTHNFIANGIAVHNSIEQDADMVILLHREDAYEKESPRAGEADFIVAKHRNGPTATLVLAFQGHYSRFVDMAHEGY